ncbi:MAG: hypothetical protein ACXABY_34870, partial [Candidatus Thorarchaeota archaeon]
EKRTPLRKVAGFLGQERLGTTIGQKIARPGVRRILSEADQTALDVQERINQRIAEQRAAGQDTSRLEGLLQQSMSAQAATPTAEELTPEADKSARRLTGEVL